jgi:hypothetical protein
MLLKSIFICVLQKGLNGVFRQHKPIRKQQFFKSRIDQRPFKPMNEFELPFSQA